MDFAQFLDEKIMAKKDVPLKSSANAYHVGHGYREQALKLFPWICGRCCREFGGKTLRELTVHHKDHNHNNNPPDGSNWELLCIYCHENEHAHHDFSEAPVQDAGQEKRPLSTFKAFEGLADLLKKKE